MGKIEQLIKKNAWACEQALGRTKTHSGVAITFNKRPCDIGFTTKDLEKLKELGINVPNRKKG